MMALFRVIVISSFFWVSHTLLINPIASAITRRGLIQRTTKINMANIETPNIETVIAPGDVQLDSGYPEIDEEALIRRINEEIFAESGVDLDQLINPSKVVNLERDLIKLSQELDQTSDAISISEIQSKINKKREVLDVEKRAVMKGWLKNLFVGQSVLAGAISLAMVYDAFPGLHVPLAIQAMGFWMWWLFIIPSLRARKPSSEEKTALNIAFLATPVVSLLMPTFTKDTAIIWWANAAATTVCYGYAYLKPKDDSSLSEEDDQQNEQSSLPPILIKAFKALDYGSGQERGARK